MESLTKRLGIRRFGVMTVSAVSEHNVIMGGSLVMTSWETVLESPVAVFDNCREVTRNRAACRKREKSRLAMTFWNRRRLQ